MSYRIKAELVVSAGADCMCDMGCGRLAEVRLTQYRVLYKVCCACLVDAVKLYEEGLRGSETDSYEPLDEGTFFDEYPGEGW